MFVSRLAADKSILLELEDGSLIRIVNLTPGDRAIRLGIDAPVSVSITPDVTIDKALRSQNSNAGRGYCKRT